MSPVWLSPAAVATADVRHVSRTGPDETVPVQRVAVPVVPAAQAVPRQLDPVARRLLALQLENEQLRAELAQLRPAKARS